MRIPTTAWSGYARILLTKICTIIFHYLPTLSAYLWANTRIVVTRSFTFVKSVANIRHWVDSFNLDCLTGLDHRTLLEATVALDLMRFRSPGRRPATASFTQQLEEVNEYFKQLGLRYSRQFGISPDMIFRVPASPLAPKTSALQLVADYVTRTIRMCGRHAAITREDKGPNNSLWIAMPNGLLLRWFGQLSSTARWEVLSTDSHLLIHSVASLVRLLPARFKPRWRRIAFSDTPYIYPTIRFKCWKKPQDGDITAHICSKPACSCHCSFAKVPYKELFRVYGRHGSSMKMVGPWVHWTLPASNCDSELGPFKQLLHLHVPLTASQPRKSFLPLV